MEESLKIKGMHCHHCVNAVKNALEEIRGVDVEHVEIGEAKVQYNPEATDHAHLVSAIEEIGYEVV